MRPIDRYLYGYYDEIKIEIHKNCFSALQDVLVLPEHHMKEYKSDFDFSKNDTWYNYIEVDDKCSVVRIEGIRTDKIYSRFFEYDSIEFPVYLAISLLGKQQKYAFEIITSCFDEHCAMTFDYGVRYEHERLIYRESYDTEECHTEYECECGECVDITWIVFPGLFDLPVGIWTDMIECDYCGKETEVGLKDTCETIYKTKIEDGNLFVECDDNKDADEFIEDISESIEKALEIVNKDGISFADGNESDDEVPDDDSKEPANDSLPQKSLQKDIDLLNTYEYVQTRFRGSKSDIDKLVNYLDSEFKYSCDTEKVNDSEYEIKIKSVKALEKTPDLVEQFPDLKATGLFEVFEYWSVMVWFSDYGCPFCTHSQRAGGFDPKAECGESRWAWENDMMSDVDCEFEYIQTGDIQEVFYSYPFADLWGYTVANSNATTANGKMNDPKSVSELKTWVAGMQQFIDGGYNPDNFAGFLQDMFDSKCEYSYDESAGTFSFVLEVVGTQYEGRSARIENLKVGDPVKVEREPDNMYNSNNLAVRNMNGESLGNFGGDQGNHISPVLDGDGYVIRNAQVASVVPKSQRGAKAKKAELYVSFEVVKSAKTSAPQEVEEELDAEDEVIYNGRFTYKHMQKASGKGYEIIIPDEFKLVKGDGQRDFTATTSVKGWTSGVFDQITFYSSMILPMSIEIPNTLAKLKKATYENIKQTLPMMEFVAKQMGATKKPVVNDISSDRMACAVISIKTRDCFYHYPQVVTSAGFRQFRIDMLTEKLGMSFDESIEYVKDLMSTVEVDLEFKDVEKNRPVPSKAKSVSASSTQVKTVSPVAAEEPKSILDSSVQSSLTFDRGKKTNNLKGMVISVPDGFKCFGSEKTFDKSFKLYQPGSDGISNSPFLMVIDSVESLSDCDDEFARRMALIDGEKAIMKRKKMVDGIIPCSRSSILYRIMATKHVFTILFVVPNKLFTFNVTTKPKYGFSKAVADIRELFDHIVIDPDFAGIKPVDDESYLTKPDKNEIEAWRHDVSECQKLITEVKEQETKHLKGKNKASLLDESIYKAETQRISGQYKSVMGIVNSGIVSVVNRVSDWPAEILASFCRKAQGLICESKGVDSSGKEQIQLMLKNANAMVKAQKEAEAEAIRQERINSRVNPRLIEVEDHSVPVPKVARDQYKEVIEATGRNKGVAKRKINSLLAEYPDYPEAIWLKMLLDLGIKDDNGLPFEAESIFEDHVDLMFEAISKGSVSFALNKIKLLYSFAGEVNNSVCYDLVYRLISYDFNDRDQLLAKLIESSLKTKRYDVIAAVMIFLKLPEELELFRSLYDKCCDASRKDDGVKAIHEFFTQYELTGYEVLEEFNRFVEVMENDSALSDTGVDLSCYDENTLSMLFRMLIDHILLCSDYDKNHYIDELAEYPEFTDEILQESSDRIVRNYMVVGKRLYDKKKYEDAYNIFNTVRTIEPENAQAGYYLCRIEKMNSKSVEYIWETEGFDDCVADSDVSLIEIISKDVSKDKQSFESVISKEKYNIKTELEPAKKDLETAKSELAVWEMSVPDKPKYGKSIAWFIVGLASVGFTVYLGWANSQMGGGLTFFMFVFVIISICIFFLDIMFTSLIKSNFEKETEKRKNNISKYSKDVEDLQPRVEELSQKLDDVEAHEKRAKFAINKVIYKRVKLGLGEELTKEDKKTRSN